MIGYLCKWKEINLIEGKARSRNKRSLLQFVNLLFGEVPTERSEGSTIQTINNRSWRPIYG